MLANNSPYIWFSGEYHEEECRKCGSKTDAIKMQELLLYLKTSPKSEMILASAFATAYILPQVIWIGYIESHYRTPTTSLRIPARLNVCITCENRPKPSQMFSVATSSCSVCLPTPQYARWTVLNLVGPNCHLSFLPRQIVKCQSRSCGDSCNQLSQRRECFSNRDVLAFLLICTQP